MTNQEESKNDRLPRGSKPLIIDLKEAISILETFYIMAGGIGSKDDLSQIMDNSPSSSTFRRKLAVLKNFDLVDIEKSQIQLTKTGQQIVAPTDKSERIAGLKKAFLCNDIFKSIYDKFAGKLLPQDEFLVNSFIPFVPRDVAKIWMQQFKESANFAGLLIDRGENKFQVREGLGINGEIDKEKDDEKSDEEINGDKKPMDEKPLTPSVVIHTEKTAFQFLIEILNPAEMSPEEQQAVWTLIQYLKKKETGVL